jgi:selenocysteine lyase/cysteine desulfurase
MKEQNDKDFSRNAIPHFNDTRRNFLKMCSVATMSGVSSLLLPRTSEAFPSLDLLKAKTSEGIFDERYWAGVRMCFSIEPGLIHMNTGTEGSMPRCVTSRMGVYFKKFAKNSYDAIHDTTLDEARTKAADFVGAKFEETQLTSNTLEGIAFVANGLDLQEEDEVLTTHHFQPFNSMFFVVKRRKKITLTELYLPTPATEKNEIVDIFKNAITPQTKVMCFCHINYTTGLRMPVKELCQLARDHNIISVVDGAHGIGMLNLDLHDLGCDF